MYVEVLTDASAFQILRTEWLDLLATLPFQSVFFTPQWQATWWQHFGAPYQLHLLTVRSEDGTLHGLAPLMRRKHEETPGRLEFIGDTEWCDYLDVLIAPGQQQEEVRAALVEALVAEVNDDQELCLRNLATESPTLAFLRDGLGENGLSLETDIIETCPVITLPSNWDDYLLTLRGKDRHEMRRKIRRAEAAATLQYYVTAESDRLEEDIETFIALHRMSQQHAKQAFMSPEKAAFFQNMVRALWPQGWVELAFLYADGHPIAALCCFPYGARYSAYNSGYHPDYAELSAGIVLFAERIRSAITRNFAIFDFLRGNESYKYRFGATDRPLSQFTARTACPVQGPSL